MQIAVIGVGNVGSAFGRAAVRAGHHVDLAALLPEHARTVAHDIGAVPAANDVVAVKGAQVVRRRCHQPAQRDLQRPGDRGHLACGAVQRTAGSGRVVKTFNTVLASRYADPTENGRPLQVHIAGNDEGARGVAGEVARSLGFDPLDVGGLRFARSLEEMAFLNITLNAIRGWPWQTGWQLVGPMG